MRVTDAQSKQAGHLKRTSLSLDKPKRDHLDTPQEGIGNQGATTKGGKGKEERSYFRNSESVGERI